MGKDQQKYVERQERVGDRAPVNREVQAHGMDDAATIATTAPDEAAPHNVAQVEGHL